jgi:type IV pilus assembly protein PilO
MFLVLLVLAGWFGWQTQYEELDAKLQEETKLKDDWLNKKKQAVNLDEYRNQLAEIERSFGTLLKQLPNASEMESLLIDINQAGLGVACSSIDSSPSRRYRRTFMPSCLSRSM